MRKATPPKIWLRNRILEMIAIHNANGAAIDWEALEIDLINILSFVNVTNKTGYYFPEELEN